MLHGGPRCLPPQDKTADCKVRCHPSFTPSPHSHISMPPCPFSPPHHQPFQNCAGTQPRYSEVQSCLPLLLSSALSASVYINGNNNFRECSTQKGGIFSIPITCLCYESSPGLASSARGQNLSASESASPRLHVDRGCCLQQPAHTSFICPRIKPFHLKEHFAAAAHRPERNVVITFTISNNCASDAS